MLQRATTVLGGAASLVRKKSEENALAENALGRARDRDRNNDEPRSSSGSGGRLTKSPPPGKISKESKEREREGSVDAPASAKGTPLTHPGREKPSPSSAFLGSPMPRRSLTDGGQPSSPLVTRDFIKPRNRASILSTFRGWFDDGRRKRKAGSPFSTPNNSPAGGLLASSPGFSGYSPGDSSGAPFSGRPYIPRKRSSSGKGTTSRRHRNPKDRRHSISSRRSSSAPSRRSSIGSMASIPNVGGTLGSVGEYTVYNGSSLVRRPSDGSRNSFNAGAITPLEEDVFDPSRPSSASQRAPPISGVARIGKSHSKSSSTSSGGSMGRNRKSNRPSSRSETRSPTSTVGRVHQRAGSGSSQTRVVKQARKIPSAGRVLATTAETPVMTEKTRHGRSNSVSSMQSGVSSVVEDEVEFGSRRAASPISRPVRTIHVAQKKQTTYGAPSGAPSGSIGYGLKHSSWKKSWGLEPPGWAHRASNQSVVIEVLDTRNPKGGLRDVFAGGGKSGVAPGMTLPDDGNDDDWSDIDDDMVYAGGLGQLGSTHTPSQNANGASPGSSSALESPLLFAHSNSGRRTKRAAGPGMVSLPSNPPGGSPLPSSSPLPITPTNAPTSSLIGMDGLGLERNTSRRQLPAGRAGFRGPAIVEEEEEEEE